MMNYLQTAACVVLWALIGQAAAGCFEQTNCTSCTSYSGNYFFPCTWCPMTHQCHTSGSLYNDCYRHVYIPTPELCPVEDSKPYNQTLAAQIAQWAAMAYAPHTKIDPKVLSKVLRDQLPGNYKMLKIIQRQCDLMVNYSACTVLVAMSHQEKNIIVSFEGTQNMDQLYEQFITTALAGLANTRIGGQVLFYNENLQKLLYPCLKSYLEEILAAYSNYTLTMTGHSLGGAQAQIAAATLVRERIISTDKLLVYTYGAPRFADVDFVSIFDKLVKTNWRLIQARDPVPKIPPSYYLYHTHGEVWFSTPGVTVNSEYVICTDNEDESCAWSQGPRLCFTDECVRIHKNYFIKDMGYAFDEQRLGGPRRPNRSKLGECDSLDFSEI